MTKAAAVGTLACLLSTAAIISAQRADGDWNLVSADLDVKVGPDSSLTFAGTLRLRLAGESSPGPALFLGGGGLAFDSAAAPAGGRVVLSSGRDTVSLYLGAPAPRRADVVVRAWWRAPSRVGRNIAAGRAGALVSWGAIWYPIPTASGGRDPSLLAPGHTSITVPPEWRTLSNGRLTDSTVADGWRRETWHTTQPVARSFIAGPYRVGRFRVGTREVGVYLLPRHGDRAPAYAQAIPRMVRILAARFGPYPFESFAIAEVPGSLAPPGFGGRSEQGYFLAHTDALESPGVNLPLFAHELAHMWFPNLVDSRPPGDDMMDEAIASYAVALVLESTDGADAARAELVEGNPDFSERAYFHYVRRGVDEPLMADYSPLIARAKGPMVYRMLRERVGDRVFFATLRDFLRKYAGRGASLTDLRAAFLAAAPRDSGLRQFFAEWLDRSGAPVLEVFPAGRQVRIVQQGPRYHLPVELALEGSWGSTRRTVAVSDSAGTFSFRTPGPITGVRVDPDHKLLLWRPEFGPHPSLPGVWNDTRWEQWLRDQSTWLMQRYGVRQVRLLAVDSGRVTIRASIQGSGLTDAEVLSGQGEIATVAGSGISDSVRVEWRASAEAVTLIAVGPGSGQAVRIEASGGWGGRQLAMNLAQEIALRYGWRRIPR